MKQHIAKFIILLASLTAFEAQATEVLPGQYEISGLLPGPAGIHIQLSPNPVQCSGNWWGTQAVIKKAETNYNTLSANIMAAFAANKKISAVHYNTAGNGTCSSSNELTVIAFKVSQ